jgi:uncharacterized coiled-coil protein SlyX
MRACRPGGGHDGGHGLRRFALAASIVGMLLCGVAPLHSQEPPKPAPKKASPKKKSPTLAELNKLLAEQKALIEEQQRQIADQQAKIAEQEARLGEQSTAIDEQKAKLAAMEEQLATLTRRFDEIRQESLSPEAQKALEERLKKVEGLSTKVPELPPDVVSAGDFPGSIRIPGTDAAVKFGGRIRAAAVFTMDPLGSEDRFLTNSIPVEPSDEAAGKGKRTTFSANTSRFNFEMRTPSGSTQLRTFIEGDFFGVDGNDVNTNFRLRHAYAQFRGFIVGQTWSTFSDPEANHQSLDFEGINGENVIRQAQFRYWRRVGESVRVAGAIETPRVSLTGGQGVNVVPDLIARAVWEFKEIGHLQGAVVFREIRGETTPPLTPNSDSATAWGATMSGVLPFHYFDLVDRFIFQVNAGKGIARYINDLNSLGGQDAVFDPATGKLEPLPAIGLYLDYEHQWTRWVTTREMKLRSSLIWSFVKVDNLDFQLPTAYKKTNRYSANLVFSPNDRIDVGVEYINGERINKDGHRGNANQVQLVAIYRF